jgi:hypothetical protein
MNGQSKDASSRRLQRCGDRGEGSLHSMSMSDGSTSSNPDIRFEYDDLQNQEPQALPNLESAKPRDESKNNNENDSVENDRLESEAGDIELAGELDCYPSVTERACGIIAIGVVTASSEEQDLESLSERVAKDIAEREHNLKVKRQDPHEFILSLPSTPKRPAMAAYIPPPALKEVNSNDLSRVALDLERQKSASSISLASTSSGIDLDEKTRNRISRSAFARAQRLSGQDSGTTMDRTRSSRSFLSLASSDVEDEARNLSAPAASRPSDEKERVSNVSSRVARRYMSSEDMGLRHTAVDGVISLPRADSTLNPREGSQDAAQLPATAWTSNVALQGESESEQQSDGLNVVDAIDVDLPGAFAISGRRRRERLSSECDSGFDDNTSESEEYSIGQETDTSLQSRSPTAPQAPVQAELYEEHFANARVVEFENGKDERRTRIFQGLAVLASVVGLVAIVLAIVLTQRKRSEGSTDFETSVPSIFGWHQVGETLLGPANQDNIRFGFAVAVSGDGNRLAVGLPGLDDEEDSSNHAKGSVFIMDFNGTEWLKVGQIDGLGQGTQAGASVKLSYDGNRVAIGCPGWSAKDGYVAVYEEIEVGVWAMVGDLIPGLQGEGQEFGGSLAFSSDATLLAVGAKFASTLDGNMENVGSVRVFNFTNSSWTPLGGTIYGENAGDLFGWGVAISENGMRIAGTALGANSFTGKLLVCDYTAESWKVVGNELVGNSERENFGASVALSADGKIVAVGATGFSAGGTLVGAGCVRIFQWGDTEELWELTGTISGHSAFDRFGSSVALSSDGKKCAIGGPENDAFGGSNSGHVRVVEQNAGGTAWTAIGSELGEAEIIGGQFGTSVALSAIGSRVVAGAPLSTFDGFRSEVGRVVIYDTVESRTLLRSKRGYADLSLRV